MMNYAPDALKEDVEGSKNQTSNPVKGNKCLSYIGFGPDLNLLAYTNSWIGLCYIITGILLIVFNSITYPMTKSKLQLICHEQACWTLVRESNPYSHTYNVLQNSYFYYEETHFGFWLGASLIIIGLLSGFRLTRLVINLGYFFNIFLIVISLIALPFAVIEFLLWIYGFKPREGHEQTWDMVKLRATNDLILVINVFLLCIFQLAINTPYVQKRSINQIAPLLDKVHTDVKEKLNRFPKKSRVHALDL